MNTGDYSQFTYRCSKCGESWQGNVHICPVTARPPITPAPTLGIPTSPIVDDSELTKLKLEVAELTKKVGNLRGLLLTSLAVIGDNNPKYVRFHLNSVIAEYEK